MSDMHDKINNVLTRGVSSILPSKSGLALLMTERKISLYQGFDPSMPSLHLGNLVGLMKLRQFQKLGHKVIFLVGDFTGMIGDPTDKLSTRKKLKREEVLKNTEAWKKQVSKVLDFSGKNPAEFKYNSEWNDKLNFKDLIELTSNFTVGQMIERDMFQKRLEKNEPIYLHEFLYPVAQAYDSLSMDVDLEIGGSDQIFNMLAGRTLMKSVKNKEKFVLATKLLVDKEGNKIGKTTGNALFLDVSEMDLYSGIMSFPDDVIYLGFELLTEVELKDLDGKIRKDPMQAKKNLAYEVTKLIHGDEKAKKAAEFFQKTFQLKKPFYEKEIKNKKTLLDTIAQVTESKSQAKRLITQKAVDVNGKNETNPVRRIEKGDKIKIGQKLFIKIS